MTLCGKRLFTQLCKPVDRGLARRTRIEDRAVRLLPGRSFFISSFLFLGNFFVVGRKGVFSGGFCEKGCFLRGFLW